MTSRPLPGQGPVRAFIALGANLGDAAAVLEEAILDLGKLPDTRALARSSLYRTAPVGVTGHPDYINAVAAIETALAPRPLLEALLTIEAKYGRLRKGELAPRTLDLDLLLYGDEILDEPDLHVPHPRMHERAFVLVPLAEIAPGALIPRRGTVASLLPGVADQDIERLPASR